MYIYIYIYMSVLFLNCVGNFIFGDKRLIF